MVFNAQVEVQTKVSQSKSREDIYAQIAKNYDIRSASHKEICEIAKELRESGAITGIECAVLTFNPDPHLPDYIKQNYPNYRFSLTKADHNGKRDWIAEYEARIQRDKQIGNTQGVIHDKKILDVLMRLQKKE